LVQYLQFQGQLVEVVAFGETTSARLKEAADDVIDLSANKRQFLINPRKSASS